MGLLDSIIGSAVRGATRGVARGVARGVEQTASKAISEAVSGVAQKGVDAAKQQMEAKMEVTRLGLEREAAANNPPVVVNSGKGAESVRFASKGKVIYHFNTRPIDLFVNALVVYKTKKPLYEGNGEVAYEIAQACYAAMQNALDHLESQGVNPADLQSHSATVAGEVKLTIMDLMTQKFGIQDFNVVITGLTIGRDASQQLGINVSEIDLNAPWACEFCGSVTTGDTCTHCGAPRSF